MKLLTFHHFQSEDGAAITYKLKTDVPASSLRSRGILNQAPPTTSQLLASTQGAETPHVKCSPPLKVRHFSAPPPARRLGHPPVASKQPAPACSVTDRRARVKAAGRTHHGPSNAVAERSASAPLPALSLTAPDHVQNAGLSQAFRKFLLLTMI